MQTYWITDHAPTCAVHMKTGSTAGHLALPISAEAFKKSLRTLLCRASQYRDELDGVTIDKMAHEFRIQTVHGVFNLPWTHAGGLIEIGSSHD